MWFNPSSRVIMINDSMQRADSRTHGMDHTQYIEFSECRQINFRMLF